MATIRSAGVRGFRDVVTSLGADADALAVRVGLDPTVLDQDDVAVPDWKLAELLEVSAQVLGCPDLGLRMAQRHGLDMLGPLAVIIANSPTVDDALTSVSRYLRFHTDGISVSLRADPLHDPTTVALVYAVSLAEPVPVQALDSGIGFLHRAVQSLVAVDYELRSVHLPYEPVAPLAVYEEFFGAPVHPRAEAAYLRIPATLGDTAIAGADESNRRRALAYLEEAMPAESEDFAGRTRTIVHHTLAYLPPQMSYVARLLNMHERTLQRRLAAEGTGFAEIVDDVRRQKAHELLTRTDLPLARVSAALGFSEQATLTRSARRWWGSPPREIRGALR
ncbi:MULTISPECIES: AraC family transcriptional regulator [Mumia]|uniref:AraC family transcriptional regulator n=1 Tax=Mumia TaxID=1546255 RepID=UPI0014224A44|nr:AraC family transcriptional regulator [Mumia sp. ZJ430]